MWKILVLFVSILGADTLEVLLPTKPLVKRLYIRKMEEKKDYLESLCQVLRFDLDLVGAVEPVVDLEKEENSSFSYLLSMQILENQLVVCVTDLENQMVRKFAPVALDYDLKEDRRKIHLLSDRIHKEILDVEGISSCRILYTQREVNSDKTGLPWISEVWICDSDGENARQLTHLQGYCLSPGFVLGPMQGRQFFYVYHNEGQSKIYKAFFNDPSNASLLISMRGNQLLPSMSKGGRHIAFIADLAGRPDLFLQSFDSKGLLIGKPKQIYSSPKATQASPNFSPDGKKIAFVSDKEGVPRIYLLDLENHQLKPRLITRKYRDNSGPSWSFDGKKIAYSAKVDGVRQICFFDLEKEEEIVLTTGSQMKENPSWALDSLHLLYNTEGETSELYVMDLIRKKSIQISKGKGQKRFGCWEVR